jgi:hypothetical protein
MRRTGVVVAVAGVFAVSMLGVAALAGVDRPTKVKQGNLPVRFWASVAPKALPVRDAAPARLRVTQVVRSEDGSHPPALEQLELELDRDVTLDAQGTPVCPFGPQFSVRRPRDWYERRCKGAQVGHGRVEIEVQFVDQPPVNVRGSLRIYNGGTKNGKVTLHVLMYFPAPITGAIVATAKSTRIGGSRTRLTTEFPMIANGAGSITDLRLDFGQRVVSARCSDGRLQIRGTATFDDGSEQRDTSQRSCKPRERAERR